MTALTLGQALRMEILKHETMLLILTEIALSVINVVDDGRTRVA